VTVAHEVPDRNRLDTQIGKIMLYNADKSLKVGDLVLNLYSKHDNNIWEIVEIERRFLTEEECSTDHCRNEYTPGTEYNPIVTIIKVYDDQYCKVKSKSIKCYDASFVKKLDEIVIEEMIVNFKLKINNLQKILKDNEKENIC
jgi:hypothetical protein